MHYEEVSQNINIHMAARRQAKQSSLPQRDDYNIRKMH